MEQRQSNPFFPGEKTGWIRILRGIGQSRMKLFDDESDLIPTRKSRTTRLTKKRVTQSDSEQLGFDLFDDN